WPPISADQCRWVSSVCRTDSTPSMNDGNSSNCVHWLYAVWTGTSTSIDSLTVAMTPPRSWIGTRLLPPAASGQTVRVTDGSSILDAIGNTPLVRLERCAPSNGAELWLKLEYQNPTGSMKDRMARAMVEGAKRDGLISPGDTLVEYTGGSTGPALALVARAKGYRPLIVIADCFTEERFALMRALGAELDVIRSVEGRPKVTPQDIANMVARAKELAAQPGHYATDQFNNPYI